jgi:hypothetical protein
MEGKLMKAIMRVILPITLLINIHLFAQTNYSKSTIFFNVLEKINKDNRFTRYCDTCKVHLNDNYAKERISFLKKDFRIKSFNKYTVVRYWFCYSGPKRDSTIYFGLIGIEFAERKSAIKLLNKINKTERTSFRTKVSNHFKVFQADRELVIAFCEPINQYKFLSELEP